MENGMRELFTMWQPDIKEKVRQWGQAYTYQVTFSVNHPSDQTPTQKVRLLDDILDVNHKKEGIMTAVIFRQRSCFSLHLIISKNISLCSLQDWNLDHELIVKALKIICDDINNLSLAECTMQVVSGNMLLPQKSTIMVSHMGVQKISTEKLIFVHCQ